MKIISDAIHLINDLLQDGHEVRLVNDYENNQTYIVSDSEIVHTITGAILYPGYLNLTTADTPSRVICARYCGLLDIATIAKITDLTTKVSIALQSYVCCMSHPYNEHDRCNWRDEELLHL